MKKFLSLVAALVLLLSNCNLLLAYGSTTDGVVIQGFNNLWENGITSEMNENGFYFDSNGDPHLCDQNNIVRGCVRYAKRQEAGDFYPDDATLDSIPKNVQIRKMVLPTNKTGEFNIQLMIRGKEKIVDNSSIVKLCSVVVFDISRSMGSGGITVGNKWNKARDGAIEFSRKIIGFNELSNVGLVFFGTTGEDILSLSRTEFSGGTFSDVTLSDMTNIHDGLIHAKNMLLGADGNDCDNKYIVLMSDGQPQVYMSGGRYIGTTYAIASEKTNEEASIIKSNGIDIYSISYSNTASGDDLMSSIATDSGHFFKSSISDISGVYNDIFNDIYLDQISTSYVKLTSITDSLGDKILLDNINITDDSNITRSGVVYSFPIRINPTASGWVDTNNGLTMNYINSEGNPDSLVIPASKSSKIYWEQPKCDGSYPSGNGVLTGKGEFTQNWIERSGGGGTSEGTQRGKDDPYFELYPNSMSWYYTGSETPGECEWTCLAGYQLNQNSDGCEEVINTYTVEFNGNGATAGSMSNQVISTDVQTNLNPNQFSIIGYTFSGWNTDPKGNGIWYADEDEVINLVTPGGTMILYAQWTANSYTIKFDANGGNGTMSDQNMVYDVFENLNENTYTNIGYEFVGWNTKANGNGDSYADKESVKNLATSGTVTLYALWSANTYTVEFNGNGATAGSMSNQSILYGESVLLNKNNYIKDGHSFLGWNTKADGLGTGYGDQQSVSNLVTSGSITLYAQWGTNTYIVKFDGNGATAGSMSDQPIEYNVLTKLYKNTYTRDGYEFSGWNTKVDGSGRPYSDEDFVENLALSGSVKLYAQWTPNSYTIVFDGNGATSGSMGDQNMDYDDTDILNKDLYQREGYTFSGWNTEPDGSGDPYEDEASVSNLVTGGTVTLYVQWTPNPYTIEFDGNGASTGTMSNQNMVYDKIDNLKKNEYYKDGYYFKGWNTKADGTGRPYSDEASVKNLVTSGTVTLYAQWGRNSTGGSSGGGGGLKKDNCPDGDYSGDFYDKKCGSKVKTGKIEVEPEEKTEVVTPSEPAKPSKKCSIEGSKHSKEVNDAYVWACENGIINSNTIQGARLGEFLNRAEMAKIVTVFETSILDAKPNINKDCSAFADSISGYNVEMRNYMVTSCQLERMGIHTANHKPITDFMPRKFVSRAEFGTILSRILWGRKYEASRNSSKYYVDHLDNLKSEGILTNINPELKERRSYAVLMVYRAAKSLGKA